ncbi:MAG TPA: hypothetical protein VFP61_07570 [Acidimicrobiales bacterium]|nr:hypothetical protein [Acidimicrobiales bacterium]
MPSGRSIASYPPLLAAATPGGAPLRVLTEVTVDHQTRGFTAFEGTPQPGQALVALPQAPAGSAYLVELIALSSTSTNPSTADVFVGDMTAPGLADHSSSADEDIAFEQPPILVPGGQQLYILWYGLSPNAAASARVQWRVVQFVPVTYS